MSQINIIQIFSQPRILPITEKGFAIAVVDSIES